MDITLSSIVKNTIQPLSISSTISDALESMHKHSISSVVITNSANKPVGIFTEHDSLKIISKNLDKSIGIENIMSTNVYYVKSSIYMHDAYMLMDQHNFRHMIVVDEDEKYLGVVSEGDFLRHFGFEGLVERQAIKDVMNNFILTISKDTYLDEVTKLMTKNKQDYAVMVENNIPIGILTERDITYHCLEDTKLSKKTKADELVPIKNFHSINKNTPLQSAAQTMEGHGIHQVLVTNEKKELVGLVTRHDILKALHGAYFDFLLRTIETKNKNEQVLLEQKHELWLIANHDQLTNLPNRFQLIEYLNNSMNENLQGESIAVILMDLKKFKDINNSYGHDIGDEVLNITAKKLLKFANKTSMIARLGNNEFAVAINHVEKNTIKTIGENILKELQTNFELSNGISINISSSIGISHYPQNANNAKEILQQAETALHEAKKESLCTLKCYDTQMTKKNQQRLSYQHRLKNAIKNNELELYFQPQVHIQTNKIVGLEALLRWKDSTEGFIPPEVFIPIAEESGLINPIGEWVINEACQFGKQCLDLGHRFTIAVNVSASQFKYQNIPEIISQALSNSSFQADKLEIEITESSIMQRAQESIKTLHAIRALGIRIAIDDFGTGYSSLSYLKKFPIDVLKIDKSFIDDVPYSKDDMAIVLAIIEMGRALGYEVLAEGIETKEQLDFLKEKNCSLYQGFYTSKALSKDALLTFLNQ